MNKESDNEQEILLLIEHFILVANSLKGTKFPEERYRFAEPLAKKTLSHIVSAFSLYRGTKIILSDNTFTESIDFSSIAVLTRAAFETFLTFDYVMVQPKTLEEQNFRFYCWDLAGFVERENYPAKDEKFKLLKENEQQLKNKLIKQLEKNSIYKSLSNRQRKKVLNGQWKIDKGWVKLAELASFNPDVFKHFYSFLCSYAHSGRLSIMQIQQIKEIEKEKKFSEIFQTINLIILSRLLLAYVTLFPTCQQVFESNEKVVRTVRIWFEVGNQLKL